MLRDCLLAFVALFVAVDILGVIPLYLHLTAGLPAEERSTLPQQSVLTATLVGLGFLLVGDAVFRVLGISVSDFQIAGGILLVILSLHDLLAPPGKAAPGPIGRIGAVPLGTPLIVGPAALATLALLVGNHGLLIVLIAFAANMLVAYLVLRYATVLGRAFGQAGADVIAKVANLLLAAFGVSLVRRGLMDLLRR
ncbi:MAG TPA: MarC family protein [Candidatus Baltobacteraceae bacterium]|nr:MarC family protein [Candidatus Baltobacteraceae bacterium]